LAQRIDSAVFLKKIRTQAPNGAGAVAAANSNAVFDQEREEILNSLFRDHAEALRRFLRMQLLGSSDCEDVLQDVWLRLAKIEDIGAKFSARPETVRSYLFAMARNLVKDRFRRARVRNAENHIPYDDDRIHILQVTPEESVRQKQRLESMAKSLNQMKTAHSRAFVLSRFDDLSYKEIAEDLEVSVSTVEKYISSALAVLREERSK